MLGTKALEGLEDVRARAVELRLCAIEQRRLAARQRLDTKQMCLRVHERSDAIVRTEHSDLCERTGRTKLPDMAAVTEPTKVILGRNLRLRRKQLAVTQEFVASGMRMHRHHLSPYENGKIDAGDDKLDAFASVLKCERWWLTTPHPEEWRAWDID